MIQFLSSFTMKESRDFLLLLTAIAGLSSWSLLKNSMYFYWLSIVFFTPIVIALLFGLAGSVYSLLKPDPDKRYAGPKEFIVLEHDFVEIDPIGETRTAWSDVVAIYNLKWYLAVQISPLIMHIIPRRSFNSDDHYITFQKAMIEMKDNAT